MDSAGPDHGSRFFLLRGNVVVLESIGRCGFVGCTKEDQILEQLDGPVRALDRCSETHIQTVRAQRDHDFCRAGYLLGRAAIEFVQLPAHLLKPRPHGKRALGLCGCWLTGQGRV
jgi:hypothetical protein